MEHLTKTIGYICILVMVTGILADLGSFPVIEKLIRFVTALYIIVAFFKSLEGTKYNVDMQIFKSDFTYEQNYDYLTEMIINKTNSEIEALVKKRLEEKNISYNLLSLHILEQNGSLIINEINIQCDNKDTALAYDCIKDLISKDTKITIGEQESEV